MSDAEHIVSIIGNVVQAIAAVVFFIAMSRFFRTPKKESLSKEQEAAVVAELERQYKLTSRFIEIMKNSSSLGR
ncbi:TPA: hypothetical protein L3I95_002111 [Enterobacter cloacae]|nr:hypothetical protein [Enterobacter cloacae]